MDIHNKAADVQLHRSQKRGIWLTVIACLVFMAILWGLFFHKITTPRYLSSIELRVNGLVLLEQPQLLSVLQGGEAVAEQLPPGKWALLLIHRGHCGAICVERIAPLASMLSQLQLIHREKTQLILTAEVESTAKLTSIIRRVDQNESARKTIKSIALDPSQRQTFENTIEHFTHSVATVEPWPKIIIVDDAGDYRGHFTTPFDANKMLLTYSSVIEHR